MKPGTTFEKLSAEVFTALRSNPQFETVEHDVHLPSADGSRQIDVLLRGRVGPFEILTVVECKDTGVVPVGEIDALHSKIQDVRAQKAVMVARKGFSKTARQKAARLGITLCTLQQAKHARWPILEAIPFVFEEVACRRIRFEVEFTANSVGIISPRIDLSRLPLGRIVAEHWNTRDLTFEGSSATYNFTVRSSEPIFLQTGVYRDEIEKLIIMLDFERSFYFGYLNEVGSTKCLRFVETGMRHVLIDPRELGDYRTTLPKFSSRSQIPIVEGAVSIKPKVLFDPQAVYTGGDVTRVEEMNRPDGPASGT